MKVRNIVRKAVTLGSGAALIGSTLMGALAYDLGDYPAQFVVDGQFDGKIVVGARASPADVLGAIDISASLQAASVTQETVEIPGQAGEVTLTGDAFRIETTSDLLELREPVGDVFDTLTDAELEALGGGTITTDQGSTDYYQYLRLGDSTSNTALQKMAVNYAEDESDVLGDFLVIDDSAPFFEWEIEFTEGLESEVDTTNDELDDLEDETFNIFGTEFTFVDSSINEPQNDDVTLTFMAGQIADTLREGETRVYSIDGVDYEVTLVFVSDPSGSNANAEAKFSVNGELTDALQDGDTDTLSGGLQIGVRDLLVNSREGVVSFFLGADKVEFTDAHTDNTLFDGTVEISNENIEDADIDIRGGNTTSSGDKYEVNSIYYRLTADASVGSTIYVPPGHGVREFLDEPQGLLSPSFDIRYEGLTTVPTHEVRVKARGDHSYDFVATNLRGKEYTWPLLTNKASAGAFKWGDDDDDFWFTETTPQGGVTNASATDFFIGDDDYFLVSEGDSSSNSEKDDSAVMRYDDIDTSDKILSFTDQSTGETKEVTYTTTTGGANGNEIIGVASNFVVEGNTYTIYVGNSSLNSLAYPLLIDLNGDGSYDGAQTTFTVKGGSVINFDADAEDQVENDNTVQTGGINMTISTPANQFDDSSLGGDEFNWTITSATGNEVRLSTGSYSGPHATAANSPWGDFDTVNDNSNDDYDRGITDYGTMIDYYNPSGSDQADEITFAVPEDERGAQVFIVAGTVESSVSGAGGVTRDVVNPLAVGIAVLDSDAPALGSENLIIVGGPCANTVAADFLGNPAQCGDGFEAGKAVIQAKEFGDSVAVLVAGYEAQETQGASRVLASYADYALSGSEVEVVVADLNSITVNPVAMDDMADA